MQHTRTKPQDPGTPRLTRRGFLRLGAGILVGTAGLGGLGTLYGFEIEPGWIAQERQTIEVAGLPSALEGLTIAQISDLHVGPHVSADHIARAVEMIMAEAPDLIAITGDMVTRSGAYILPCSRALAGLSAPLGVYAVLGNHDIWTDPRLITDTLTREGITVLGDETQVLSIDGARLAILGIEDAGFSANAAVAPESFARRWNYKVGILGRMMRETEPTDTRLLLCHNPDFCELLGDYTLDLTLCGHTHGGQVSLPVVGPPILPSCNGQKYASGLVQAPAGPAYVNRGLGATQPTVRFNCRPEITYLTLERA